MAFNSIPCFDIMELIGAQVVRRRLQTERRDRVAHEDDFISCLNAIEDLDCWWDDSPASDQYFCELFHREHLTEVVCDYRRSGRAYQVW